MAKPNLQKLCTKWQKILRLQDWIIDVRYCRHHELTNGKGGYVHWLITKKHARILVLDPFDYNGMDVIVPADPEITLVHELVHLQLAPFDDTKGTDEELLEQAVECLSRSFVELDRKSQIKDKQHDSHEKPAPDSGDGTQDSGNRAETRPASH